MQAMELVDIEDVYPYEENDVRMNPRDVSSKECREYIGQLAEQFKYNKLNPGQPRVRPILYRDGGIYQIIDGECRYWAMRKLGTKRFYADVFDDLAAAETARQEAAKAMVETDAKRALTPEEMSKGVQTMLALDIPDEEVAAVARIDKGSVKRARRAAKATGDAAYDMTLDRLIAIDEFAGDEEAVSKLRDCPAKDWHRVTELTRQAVKVMLGLPLEHIGINSGSPEKALADAKALCALTGLALKEGNSSVFAGSEYECMKNAGRGANGHIALSTPNLMRAKWHLEQRGVEFDEDSLTVRDGRPAIVYMKNEIAGFAIHLLQK